MASSVPLLATYLLIACIVGAGFASTHVEGITASQGAARGRPRGDMVHLLRMSLRDIYVHSAQLLKQELDNSLAVVDGAVSGDTGPAKRNSAGPGSTSLGSGPLYFLARGLGLDEASSTFDDTVEHNERLFDIAGRK